MTADVSVLVGRHFVALSGNVGRIQQIAPGALRIVWERRDSEADRAEFEEWAISILQTANGDNLDLTTCTDIRKESAMLAEWKARK